MAGAGDIVSKMTLDNKGWLSGAAGALGALRGLKLGVSSIASTLGSIGLASQGLSAIKGAISSTISPFLTLAAEAEQTAVAFEVMLGSGDAASTMLAQMRQFASTTPLDTAAIQESGKTLLQFGIDGKQVLPILKMLGDVSGGNAERMKGMATVFGQMSATGRLMGGDLLQFINQGFNPLQEISEHTGKSMAELKTQMEAGGISASMVAESFQRATAQGGQFYGMLDKQGQTTAGLFGQLQDAVSLSMTDIGSAIIRGFDLNGLMQNANSFLDSFRSEWLPGITTGINQMGAAFQRATAFMATSWGEWTAGTVASLVEFVSNFDLYWQIAQQNIVLWVANNLNRISTFFTNAGELAAWFGDNFGDIFYTSVDYVATLAINLAENLKSIWQGVLDFIAGKGFNVDFKPLADGFRNTIKKMPEYTKAAVDDTTPELEALYQQLASRQAAAASGAVVSASATPEAGALDVSKLTGSPGGAKKGSEDKTAGALQAGSAQAASSIAKAFNENRNPLMKLADQQLKEAKKQTQILVDLRNYGAAGNQYELMPANI